MGSATPVARAGWPAQVANGYPASEIDHRQSGKQQHTANRLGGGIVQPKSKPTISGAAAEPTAANAARFARRSAVAAAMRRARSDSPSRRQRVVTDNNIGENAMLRMLRRPPPRGRGAVVARCFLQVPPRILSTNRSSCQTAACRRQR